MSVIIGILVTLGLLFLVVCLYFGIMLYTLTRGPRERLVEDDIHIGTLPIINNIEVTSGSSSRV